MVRVAIPWRSSSRRVRRVSSAAMSGTVAEDLERAQRDVGQVADRRRDDVQATAPAGAAAAAPAHRGCAAEPGRRRG